jgi:flagellar motility protein MotE (MotC chaperone)
MPDEAELTPDDLLAVGLKKKRSKTLLLIAGGLAALAVLYLAGSFAFKKLSGSHEPSAYEEEPTPMLFAGVEKSDTAGMTDLLTDTLEFVDLPADPVDTLAIPVVNLTSDVIDTAEAIPLPGDDHLSDPDLLNALVTEATVLDTSLDFETGLLAPIRPLSEFEIPKFPWEVDRQDRMNAEARRLDSLSAALAAQSLNPKVVEVPSAASKATIDSMAAQLAVKDNTINIIAEEKRQYEARFARLKGDIDAAREAQVKKLVKIVEAMKPSAAAELLSKSSPDEISEILFKVKPKTASKILQYIPVDIATQIAAEVVRK